MGIIRCLVKKVNFARGAVDRRKLRVKLHLVTLWIVPEPVHGVVYAEVRANTKTLRNVIYRVRKIAF